METDRNHSHSQLLMFDTKKWRRFSLDLAKVSTTTRHTTPFDKNIDISARNIARMYRDAVELTMRAELIGHLKPCMTEIYLHN